jgi:hypothetical protein
MENQEKVNNILGYLWSLYCDDNMEEGRKVLVNTDSLLEDHINGMDPKQAFVAGTKADYRPDGDVSRGEFVNGVLAWEAIYWLQHHKVPVIRKLRKLGEALDRCNNHSKCPNCGGEDIDWDIADQEGYCYWQKGECATCGCVFNEVWSMVLSDIEILERGELNFDDLTTADYIELFNLMNNRYTQGNRLVFPNTNGAITTEFKDFRDFAARVCKGDYHSNDSWCQINAHGNIITFTELEDSEINVLHIKEWLERSQENRDLANTKLGKNRF